VKRWQPVLLGSHNASREGVIPRMTPSVQAGVAGIPALVGEILGMIGEESVLDPENRIANFTEPLKGAEEPVGIFGC